MKLAFPFAAPSSFSLFHSLFPRVVDGERVPFYALDEVEESDAKATGV